VISHSAEMEEAQLATDKQSRRDKPYTVPEVAERWQCSREFVYEQIRRGRLQAFRLGKKLIRIPPEEVDRWESAQAAPEDDQKPNFQLDLKLIRMVDSNANKKKHARPKPKGIPLHD